MSSSYALSAAHLERFILDGFLRIEGGFATELAAECRAMLWRGSGCREGEPETWTRPVVRLGEITHPRFAEAANTPRLRAAYDALVGEGRWLPRAGMGTFPLRFPSAEDPGDCGWHVDMSFGFEGEPDFLRWRVNASSRGRALLMLFLFSEVTEDDAPTKLRVGSHLDIARRLAPHGEEGLTLGELASSGFAESAHREETLATGPAGTVFLCHPFLVHTAQPHRGRTPRFMAQPPLLPRGELRQDGSSPVERALRGALGR